MLGGIAGLASFLFLPFALNPLYLRPDTGIQLLQSYMSRADPARFAVYGGRQVDYQYYIPFLISYISLWAIPILCALIALLAIFALIKKRAGLVLPLFSLLASALGLICLFLMFFEYQYNIIDFIQKIVVPGKSYFSLTHPGWWVCLPALLLAFVASLMGIVGRGKSQGIR